MKSLIEGKITYAKALLKIAVPIILSNIIAQVQMIIDRAFLGHVNDMYMSALSNVNSPVWTTMAFCFSLGTGASILISQAVGAGEKEKLSTYSSALLKWNNIVPVMLFLFWTFFAKAVFRKMGVSENLLPICLEYIRWFIPIFLIIGIESSTMIIMQTSNHTMPLVVFGVVRAGLNVLLDWVMIFGKLGCPALGIKGAAIATTVSEYIGFLVALAIFVSSKKLFTRPGFKETLKAPIMPFLKSAKLGLNTALEDFAWNFGNLILIRILNSISEKAAGIYTIVFSVEILVVVVIGSLGQGTMTLSGEAVGKCDRKQFKSVGIVAYSLSAASSLVVLAVSLLIPSKIIGIFTADSTIIEMCSFFLVLICINLFAKAANIIVGNGIRGSGNTGWMFFTQIFGTCFIVSLASLFVYVFKMGITGVFLAVLTDEFVRAIINLCKYIKIIKKIPNAEVPSQPK